MKRRALLLTLGIVFLLVGCLLPRDWYDALPRAPELPDPPIKGVTLLQFSLVLEGLVFLWLALQGWDFVRLGPSERLPVAGAPQGEAISTRTALYLLAAITILALTLRLLNLNSDLWLDEIAITTSYSQMPVWQVIAGYTSFNNHLLNTLLVKLAIAWAGEEEWAIRLPAALFGTATIPALYWVSRLALSRRASLGAALLLAVSYHHIFFSQNARGYSAYLFFSLLASGLLVKGLREDRARIWMLYLVAMVCNFAALLNSSFVFAAHILVGAAALIILKRRGAAPLPLLKRLSAVFAALAFLGFQLYALILPQTYIHTRAVYADPAVGFSPFSMEFLKEVTQGISVGFGTGLLLGALPFLAIAGAGFLIVFRRQWALAAALILPLVLTTVYLLVGRLNFAPRLFLLALPVAILSVVQGLFSCAGFVADRLRKSRETFAPRLAAALVLAVCVVSLASLRYYYFVPKQNYRASLQYLENLRQGDGIVIVIHLAEAGYRYYGRRVGLKEGEDCFFVRSLAAFEAVLSEHRERRSFLVTTFPRALRLSYPDLNARIAQGWVRAHTFPGTIGDGEISVWEQRQP